ncbi:MAG: U32 family peptidase [Syntrophomonadaceae bacterium]|jgi:putative protease|nr:U32 family peptidase [Syntrophomonadaceae bacterium]
MISLSQGIELLAPAGHWKALESVAEAGADAVYLGGKEFNMRQLRADFNFSREELKAAADYLHQRRKKIYVTVNNLHLQGEFLVLEDYLVFLAGIEVDALIIQDLGVAYFCKKSGIKTPLHASVQMSVSNRYAAAQLEEAGFERVILSKNLSVGEISSIHKHTRLGIEFFAHGDLCVSHTGQCFMSSFISGNSGNRGLCAKPCRWPYILQDGSGNVKCDGYLLACKDLCVLDYLKELAGAGVRSFKIEGRMRDEAYLRHLVSHYRLALDELADGRTPDIPFTERHEDIGQKRLRDFTTVNLFENPGHDVVDISGTREYVKFGVIIPQPVWGIEDCGGDAAKINQNINVSVKVAALSQLEKTSALKVNEIIISSDKMRQLKYITDRELLAFLSEGKNPQIKYLWESPAILAEKEQGQVRKQLEKISAYIDGVVANDLGAVKLAAELGLPVRGGIGLNVANSAAAEFLFALGVERILVSLEIDFEHIKEFIVNADDNIEILVQGSLCGMITDTCIISMNSGRNEAKCPKMNRRVCEEKREPSELYCRQGEYCLKNSPEGLPYLLRSDTACRNYIYYPLELCLIKRLPELLAAGLKYIRIDAQFYSDELTGKIIGFYGNMISRLQRGEYFDLKDIARDLRKMFPRGLADYHMAIAE